MQQTAAKPDDPGPIPRHVARWIRAAADQPHLAGLTLRHLAALCGAPLDPGQAAPRLGDAEALELCRAGLLHASAQDPARLRPTARASLALLDATIAAGIPA